MYSLNWSFVIKFTIVFFGLIGWIAISYYVLNEVTLYVAKNVLEVNFEPTDTLFVWLVFNAAAFCIAKYIDDFY